jgi:A/G-specific adenine glycosylase
MDTKDFQQLVIEKGGELYRDMPWRDEPSFYNVLVSEIMLQQTQVPRVLVKFAEFMQIFPTVDTLAAASLADVLRAWQGLGYNRRAKYLYEAARYIVIHGEPRTNDELQRLPGVGSNTAAAIMNYVYQVPTAFVETNIRSVYFYHFFDNNAQVTDKELLALVAKTMDYDHPREWFWALMDYGAELKSQGHGRLDMSAQYRKQTPLKGSMREVRGRIIKELSYGDQSRSDLAVAVDADDRFTSALESLIAEGLVMQHGNNIHLTS